MGHAKVLKSFYCGEDEFVSARDALWEPSTYISKAGAEGQGSILAKKPELWFQDSALLI